MDYCSIHIWFSTMLMTYIERNIRVRGDIQTFEYVWKRTRLKGEKCVVLFFSPFFCIFFLKLRCFSVSLCRFLFLSPHTQWFSSLSLSLSLSLLFISDVIITICTRIIKTYAQILQFKPFPLQCLQQRRRLTCRLDVCLLQQLRIFMRAHLQMLQLNFYALWHPIDLNHGKRECWYKELNHKLTDQILHT